MFETELFICTKMDLELNNQYSLIFHKTQTNKQTNKRIRKFEKILIKLYSQNVSLSFNQTCLNERFLPSYTYLYIPVNVLVAREFDNDPGNRSSIPRQVILKKKIKKRYLIPPWLTLSIIRYGSRVSGAIQEVTSSPKLRCSRKWKGNLRVTLDYGICSTPYRTWKCGTRPFLVGLGAGP